MRAWIVVSSISLLPFTACNRTVPEKADAASEQAVRPPAVVGRVEHEVGPTKEPASGTLLSLSPDALRDLRLTTRKAEKRPAGDTIRAVGSFEFDPAAVSAVSTPLAGRIVAITKSVGERVDLGETLVQLESLDIARANAALEASRSRVSIASARLKLAEEQRDRVRELVEKHMSTVREQQAAESEVATRKADVSEAEALVRDMERTRTLLPVDEPSVQGRFALRAASGGVLTLREGSLGESVEAGHVFFRIASTSPLHAVVHPFERDGARIDATSRVSLWVPAHPDKSFEARFLRSGPEVDAVSRTLPVRLVAPNIEGTLLPGMSVTAEFRLGGSPDKEVVTVPLAAVQRIERDWCVFMPLGGGRFERRSIARGRDLGGEIEVLNGLSDGDEVVVEGAFVLRSEATRSADTGEEHEH